MKDLALKIEQYLDRTGCWKCFCNFEGEGKSVFIYRSNGNGMVRISVDNNDNYAFISDLFVLPDKRKNGTGSNLLFVADKIISLMGLPFSQLRVKKGSWMLNWYKKRGFTELFKEDEYIWMIKKVELWKI